MSRCLAHACAQGAGPFTARPLFSLPVEVHPDRYVRHETDGALLEGMSNATKLIELDWLPREAPAIMVTRETAIEDGQVTADKPLKFSYIR